MLRREVIADCCNSGTFSAKLRILCVLWCERYCACYGVKGTMAAGGLHLHPSFTARCRSWPNLQAYRYFPKNKHISKHSSKTCPSECHCRLPLLLLPHPFLQFTFYIFFQQTFLQTRFFPRMDYAGYKIHKQVDVSRLPIWHLESSLYSPEA